MIYAAGKEPTPTQLPPFGKVKLNNENYAGRVVCLSFPNLFDCKIRCVALKCIDSWAFPQIY